MHTVQARICNKRDRRQTCVSAFTLACVRYASPMGKFDRLDILEAFLAYGSA